MSERKRSWDELDDELLEPKKVKLKLTTNTENNLISGKNRS